MKEALENCPKNVLVMGNLDPVSVLKTASGEEVYLQTKELLLETAPFSNVILSTGCDVPPKIPFDNIKAFYQALEAYNESVSA